jgi:hypothetical protein
MSGNLWPSLVFIIRRALYIDDSLLSQIFLILLRLQFLLIVEVLVCTLEHERVTYVESPAVHCNAVVQKQVFGLFIILASTAI